jgi:hypothetical protein
MMCQYSRFAVKLTFAAVSSALLLSSCASIEAPRAGTPAVYNDCFFARTLQDWRPLDDSNLILFAAGRRPYHVELVRPAMSLSFNDAIRIYDRDGNICPYGGDAIITDDFMPERIAIRSMRRLTDDELLEVYARFGVSAPPVVETEAVEVDQSE